MAELLLRPNGVGDENEHNQVPDSGEHWEKVDEVVANDDTDYVLSSSIFGSVDLYTIPAHGLLSSTVINKITLHGRFYKGEAEVGWHADAGWRIKSHLTEWVYGTALIRDAWFTDSLELLLNPITDEPWTLDELTNLQIGTVLTEGFASLLGANTQLYIVVDYGAVVKTGYIWIEGTKFHIIDATGTERSW